jgi:hypothetical protein
MSDCDAKRRPHQLVDLLPYLEANPHYVETLLENLSDAEERFQLRRLVDNALLLFGHSRFTQETGKRLDIWLRPRWPETRSASGLVVDHIAGLAFGRVTDLLEEELRSATSKLTPPPPAPSNPPTIWYHGGVSYSRDGLKPITVSRGMHTLLSAFLGSEQAMTSKALEDTAVPNVAAMVNKIAEKFGEEPIRRPGQKARGDGYFIRVRSLKKN